jgi:alpha-galactosidase
MPLLHLRNGGVSVGLDLTDAVPAVVWWGRELPHDLPLDAFELRRPWIQADRPDRPSVPLVPTQADGWTGTPGISGHSHGQSQYPRLRLSELRLDAGSTTAELILVDAYLGLELVLTLAVRPCGLLSVRAELSNRSDSEYELASLLVALPVGDVETEVVDLDSRSNREHHLQRHPLTVGRHERGTYVSRVQRASALIGTCHPGAGWGSGSARYVHVAWSGNTELAVERDPLGLAWIHAGERLLPGEVVLAPGQTYSSPEVLASWGEGLDAAAGRFHEHVRSLPGHPSTPRPVTLNAWEAVYFDQSLERLQPILEVAQRLGVERFVLDDGWFSTRRDDTSGLGDWTVATQVWPTGLGPLVAAVRAHGMTFGLWFEPEMVSERSDLARCHPDWLCGPSHRPPLAARHQQLLNLANPEARRYVRDRLSSIIAELHVDYIKWDFNRDVLEPVDRMTGRTVGRERVLATYELIDELRSSFPWLEIEACASGGGRLDLGMLARAQRLWPSDCMDPLERLSILEGVSLLLPPEMVGSHVASPTSHTTGRTHSLSFRAGVALLGHFGLEWDISTLSEVEIEAVRGWIQLYLRFRDLIGRGRLIHADRDDHIRAHGVVAPDQGEALYVVAAVSTSPSVRPLPLRLPGLDPEASYRVELLNGPEPEPAQRVTRLPPWSLEPPCAWTGWQLDLGLALPVLRPEQLILLHLTKVTP